MKSLIKAIILPAILSFSFCFFSTYLHAQDQNQAFHWLKFNLEGKDYLKVQQKLGKQMKTNANAWAYNQLAALHHFLENTKERDSLLLISTKKFPIKNGAWIELAKYWDTEGNNKEALKAINQYAKYYPLTPNELLLKANILFLSQNQACLKTLRQIDVKRLSKEDLYTYHYLLGSVLNILGDYEASNQVLLNIVEINDINLIDPIVLFRISVNFERLKKYDAQIRYLKMGLIYMNEDIGPLKKRALTGLSRTCFRLNLLDQAKTYTLAYNAIEGGNPDSHLTMMSIYLEEGNLAKACESLRQSWELGLEESDSYQLLLMGGNDFLSDKFGDFFGSCVR